MRLPAALIREIRTATDHHFLMFASLPGLSGLCPPRADFLVAAAIGIGRISGSLELFGKGSVDGKLGARGKPGFPG
jgi:hypothetical protein